MFRQDIQEFQNFRLKSGLKSFASDGCAISCVFYIVEQEINKTFTIKKIKELVNTMYKKGYIDNEFTIQGAEGWKHCFQLLGLNVKKVLYVDKNYIPEEDEREILMLAKPHYVHFVPGNGYGCYSWDSLGKRKAQKDYWIEQKRIVRL